MSSLSDAEHVVSTRNLSSQNSVVSQLWNRAVLMGVEECGIVILLRYLRRTRRVILYEVSAHCRNHPKCSIIKKKKNVRKERSHSAHRVFATWRCKIGINIDDCFCPCGLVVLDAVSHHTTAREQFAKQPVPRPVFPTTPSVSTSMIGPGQTRLDCVEFGNLKLWCLNVGP